MNLKTLALMAFTVFSYQSHAILSASCNVWNHDDKSPVGLRMELILAQHLGTKAEKMGVSPSVVTVVNQLDNSLVFSDEISHLNEVNGDGLFEVIESKIYPIKDKQDILKPKPEIVRVRRLTVTQEMKKSKDYALESFSFDIKQHTPTDGTFTGEGTVKFGGREYKGVTYNCSVYIDWGMYRAMVDKLKGKK